MSDINIKALGQQELAAKQSSNAAENKVSTATGGAPSAASQPDTVSLTDTGVQIQTLQQIISETPDVDQARVESIKAAIDNGTYTVDATEVAQNLLNFEGLLN